MLPFPKGITTKSNLFIFETEEKSLSILTRNHLLRLLVDEAGFLKYLLFLQARDEVIGILKAEKMDLALLEAQYGFVTPKKVLEALQRDAFQAKSTPWQEDIYEKPMNEVCTTNSVGPRRKEKLNTQSSTGSVSWQDLTPFWFFTVFFPPSSLPSCYWGLKHFTIELHLQSFVFF